MRIKNKSKRLICLQTKKGRVDLLPDAVTDDDRIDSVKNEKVVKALFAAGDLEVAKETPPEDKKTPKELLIEEATELGIDTTGLTIADLEAEIEEAKGEEV